MKVIVLMAALLAAGSAHARFELATLEGERRTGDPSVTRCLYKTVGGYEFSLSTRSYCRATVRIDVETGEVR